MGGGSRRFRTPAGLTGSGWRELSPAESSVVGDGVAAMAGRAQGAEAVWCVGVGYALGDEAGPADGVVVPGGGLLAAYLASEGGGGWRAGAFGPSGGVAARRAAGAALGVLGTAAAFGDVGTAWEGAVPPGVGHYWSTVR